MITNITTKKKLIVEDNDFEWGNNYEFNIDDSVTIKTNANIIFEGKIENIFDTFIVINDYEMGKTTIDFVNIAYINRL